MKITKRLLIGTILPVSLALAGMLFAGCVNTAGETEKSAASSAITELEESEASETETATPTPTATPEPTSTPTPTPTPEPEKPSLNTDVLRGNSKTISSADGIEETEFFDLAGNKVKGDYDFSFDGIKIVFTLTDEAMEADYIYDVYLEEEIVSEDLEAVKDEAAGTLTVQTTEPLDAGDYAIVVYDDEKKELFTIGYVTVFTMEDEE